MRNSNMLFSHVLVIDIVNLCMPSPESFHGCVNPNYECLCFVCSQCLCVNIVCHGYCTIMCLHWLFAGALYTPAPVKATAAPAARIFVDLLIFVAKDVNILSCLSRCYWDVDVDDVRIEVQMCRKMRKSTLFMQLVAKLDPVKFILSDVK